MTREEMIAKIEELNSIEELIEEAKNEAEAIKDALKAEMLEQNTEELTVGRYILRWTSVLSNRFDSTTFKKVLPDVYKAYLKQVSSKRFTVSV